MRSATITSELVATHARLDEKEIDHVYGPTTISAIKTFQKRNKLTDDGMAGEKTLEKLGKESGTYTVVGFVQQPDIAVPQAPRKPHTDASLAAMWQVHDEVTETPAPKGWGFHGARRPYAGFGYRLWGQSCW